MQLSPETIEVLKNFATINQSLIFEEGNTLATVSQQKTIMAKAQITDDIPADFAIYDVGRFLGFIKLFDNPSFEFTDSAVIVKNGKAQGRYTFADASLIMAPPKKDLVVDAEVEFDLDSSTLTEIMSAANVTQLPNVAIVGNGTTIHITTLDVKNDGSDNFQIPVGKTSDNFRMIFKMENWKFLDRDYTVRITSKGVSQFTAKDVEYFVAVESGSTFEG
jgi:hypothetical protein